MWVLNFGRLTRSARMLFAGRAPGAMTGCHGSMAPARSSRASGVSSHLPTYHMDISYIVPAQAGVFP